VCKSKYHFPDQIDAFIKLTETGSDAIMSQIIEINCKALKAAPAVFMKSAPIFSGLDKLKLLSG
jgi:hypothetical protein